MASMTGHDAGETPLDLAHAAMVAAPDDAAARLRFYDLLAASELFLLLEEEAAADTARPRIFPIEQGPVVLAFDREERLTAFTEGPAPYVALPGRVLADTLAGEGLGLGLNLGVAPSSMLLEAASVAWLSATLATDPEPVAVRAEALTPPADLPQAFLAALDARLARAEGLAQAAYLVGTRYDGGVRTHLLAFIAPLAGAEAALARTVSAALAFSGVDGGQIDVGFFDAADPVAARLAKVGLRFDLPPAPAAPGPAPRMAPGSDPDRPPKLR
jgi:hypothetical protein